MGGEGSTKCTNKQQGYCNNKIGKYVVTTYTDTACTTKPTEKTYVVDGKTKVTFGALKNVALISCGDCPADNVVDPLVYIASFFFAVFGYVLFICAAMFVCYKTCGKKGC